MQRRHFLQLLVSTAIASHGGCKLKRPREGGLILMGDEVANCQHARAHQSAVRVGGEGSAS